MIRAVLADDEPLARRGLAQLVAQHDDVEVVGEAASGPEAVSLVEQLRPDLLFLDIQMPGLDGFGVLNVQEAYTPLVVFVTAYEEFALRAFEVAATDYLLKPVSAQRFAACLDRIRDRLADPGPSDALESAVVVRGRTGEHVLRPHEIDWIEADDYYAAVHAGGRRFLVRESLLSLEARLPSELYQRVHRSALVNLARVRTFVPEPGGGGQVVLLSGARVPVSRRSRRALSERLKKR